MQISSKTKHNKRFKDYFDKNNLNDEEIKVLTNSEQDIYKILDLENLDVAKKLKNKLINKKYPKK